MTADDYILLPDELLLPIQSAAGFVSAIPHM